MDLPDHVDVCSVFNDERDNPAWMQALQASIWHLTRFQCVVAEREPC
jgi:hypothetical protein